jgi:hypothetical protein
MVSFMIELWLAQHANVNLRGHFIRVLGFVLAVPSPDRLDVMFEVGEESFSRGGYVPAESSRVVIGAEQYEMIQLQESFEPVIAEQIHAITDNSIKELIRGKHVQPHGVREIVAAQVESCVDRRKMTLNIAQFLVDTSQA